MKLNPTDIMLAGLVLTNQCHGLAEQCGWWRDFKTGKDLRGSPFENPLRNVPEMLCLVHSEISEAMEGYRKGLRDDHLPNRMMLEVELADAVIRIFDMAGGLHLDVAGAIADKLQYNADRADHKPENRARTGGKAF